MKVLVIDDDDFVRMVTWISLTKVGGMTVTEAGSGTEGLVAAAQDRPDVILLDVMMPGMDGPATFAALQANASIAGIPVIFLTAKAMPSEQARLSELGAIAVLTKPFDPLTLAAEVQRVVDTARKTPGTAARDTVHDALDRPAGRHAHILLADDNIADRTAALSLLQRMGLTADSVEDGTAAINAIAGTHYDLVLMDLQLPGVDAFQATRAIRESAAPHADVPIIAMTARLMRGDRERWLAAGMDDYISKPVSAKSLAAVLDRWIPEAKPLVFDKAAMMERLEDDADAAREVAASFLGDLPQRITTLRDALSTGDAGTARRQAHSIKGAASDVGGNALRAVAAEMEQAIATGELGIARAQVDALAAQFEQLRVTLWRELFP